MATLESLQAKIKKLENQAEALVAKQSSGVIEKIHELMTKHGITTADIDAHVGGKKRGPKPGAKSAVVLKSSAAKYQHPKTGATWTGRGRAPAWIAETKDRTKFLITGGAKAAVEVTVGSVSKRTGAKSVRTAGSKGQPKGPQPALYLDPKSGATWSGRGRAPAWLASVEDRSKFLITAAPKETAIGSGTVTKKTQVKKVGAKKAVTKTAVAKNMPAKRAAASGEAARTKSAAKKISF